jgi:hypothetical protein
VIRLWDNARGEFIPFLDYDIELRRDLNGAPPVVSTTGMTVRERVGVTAVRESVQPDEERELGDGVAGGLNPLPPKLLDDVERVGLVQGASSPSTQLDHDHVDDRGAGVLSAVHQR